MSTIQSDGRSGPSCRRLGWWSRHSRVPPAPMKDWLRGVALPDGVATKQAPQATYTRSNRPGCKVGAPRNLSFHQLLRLLYQNWNEAKETRVMRPNSSTGSPKRRNGRSSNITPSANASGVVVRVSTIDPR